MKGTGGFDTQSRVFAVSRYYRKKSYQLVFPHKRYFPRPVKVGLATVSLFIVRALISSAS